MDTRAPSGAAGTDAERRGARALAAALRERGRAARVQTIWVRPAWWLALAACLAAGVLASVLSVAHPLTGLIVALAAIAGALLESSRAPLLRRLTVARATQNVVSPPPARPGERPVTLVVSAAIDDPRRGLAARLPGGLPRWTLVALLLVAACAAGRLAGAEGSWIGALQLVPTLALLLALFACFEEGTARTDDDPSARGAALALVDALDAEPPRHLDVALVLAGAGATRAAGLGAWLRSRRARGMRPRDVALLQLEPCGIGTPVWWDRDGIVLPAALHPQLRAAAREAAAARPELGARGVRGRTGGAAAIARADGWPVIAVGARAPRGRGDAPERPPPGGPDATVAFAFALVSALDTSLDASAPDGSS